jgi:hypothetical protein
MEIKDHFLRRGKVKIQNGFLSEEISSRVAESTRLILAKDGFGGDSGALDRLRMNAGKT